MTRWPMRSTTAHSISVRSRPADTFDPLPPSMRSIMRNAMAGLSSNTAPPLSGFMLKTNAHVGEPMATTYSP